MSAFTTTVPAAAAGMLLNPVVFGTWAPVVVERLVRAILLIVSDERAECAPQVRFAEQDHLTQALALHGLHPASLRMRPNCLVKNASLSRIRHFLSRRKPPTVSVRLRATCAMNALFGCGVMPAM